MATSRTLTREVKGVNRADVVLPFRTAACRNPLPPATTSSTAATAHRRPIRVVHVSDTHDKHYVNVPPGDILIHSGDFTNHGHDHELRRFRHWLDQQPHTYRVIVCGNHETGLDRLSLEDLNRCIIGDETDAAAVAPDASGRVAPARRATTRANTFILADAHVTLHGITIYGSSWNNIPGMAWGMKTPQDRAVQWSRIPEHTDILVTHQPAFNVFDRAFVRQPNPSEAMCSVCGVSHPGYDHWGCPSLMDRIQQLGIPLHMCGHVHDETGVRVVGCTTFSNAAMDWKQEASVIDVHVPHPEAASSLPPAPWV